jgi:hypothetical protein
MSAMQKRRSTGMLILVELGADWPEMELRAGGRRVLSQGEGETPADFALRVSSQLEGLFGRGVSLNTTVLACNERLDDAARHARRELVRAVLGAMPVRRGSHLYLSAAERSSSRLRAALSVLATDLASEWAGSGLETSVRFGDDQGASRRKVA